ncbi:NAD(P)H-hydrate dehydratase [Georgenia sp. 10Sc9-8]|uniref:Bifunctional NAD(P)H-hydrate repair enzyme n=1 Tax=Georgenia halotolerans TaxID=3028317 RepID=A0ABT5U1B6_9MICO|nr:NAD(P)H-hydrate dehydratase [Georgenia halotolerans]
MIRAWSSTEVVAAERPMLDAGVPLMEQAAFALASHVTRALRRAGHRVPGSVVLLLVGGGNNGGDALHAGAHLARRGAQVHAALLTDRAHPEGLAAARRSGVRVHQVLEDGVPPTERVLGLARRAGVWVDGVTGVGAGGGLRHPVAEVVRSLAADRAGWPQEPMVVAVDVPSGIGVDDGTVPGPVLPADMTVTMGAAKPGLLLPPAAELAGRLEVVDLALPLPAGGAPAVCRLTSADVADLWPRPTSSDHKYTRGVLGVLAGSTTFPGAAVLSVAGAVRTGLGMVRYLGPPGATTLVHARHPEVVAVPGRVQAWVIGPGVDADDPGRAEQAQDAIEEALAAGVPVVLDAGALQLLPEDLPDSAVLTPHAGELATLLGSRGEAVTRDEVEAAPARHARLAAELTGAMVLLKGATTVVAGPTGPLYAQADAPPWLAAAGAGDVLAGVLGALLAPYGDRLQELLDSGEDVTAGVARLAAAAVVVHGEAAQHAAGLHGPDPGPGRPLSAGDVADALPTAVGQILA